MWGGRSVSVEVRCLGFNERRAMSFDDRVYRIDGFCWGDNRAVDIRKSSQRSYLVVFWRLMCASVST